MTRSLAQRRFLLLLIYAAIALPWVVRGAAQSMGSNANSPLDWVPASFPARQVFDEFRGAFGQADLVVASWEGCALTEPRLDQLVEHLRNAPQFFSAEDAWYFESVVSGRELLGQLTSNPLDLSPEVARERLRGLFVGSDGETTCVLVTFTPAGLRHRAVLVQELQRVITKVCGVAESDLHLAGPVIDGLAVDTASQHTLRSLAVPSAIVVFALCHLALRSLRAAALVFAVSLYAQGVTLALLHYAGREMSALLIVMPPLIQVLAVAGGIHLVNYYLDAARSGDPHPAAAALRAGWLPCVLSAATTAVGLGSLMLSQLAPIRDFGGFAAAGVVCTTALLLSIIPGCLMFWRWRPADIRGHHTDRFPRAEATRPVPTGWLFLCDRLQRYQWSILAITILLVAVSAWGIKELNPSVRIETLFSPESTILRDYAWLEERIGPLVPIEIILEFDPKCQLSLRQRMRVLQLCEERLLDPAMTSLGSDHSRTVISALSFLPEFPPPPYDESTPAAVRATLDGEYQRQMETILASLVPRFRSLGYLAEEGSGQRWRLTTYVSALAPLDYGDSLNHLKSLLDPLLPQRLGEDAAQARLHYTGIMPLVHEIQRQLLSDLFESFLTAFVLITLVMILLQGSVVAGLIAMVPNVLPTLLVFGGMGWSGVMMDIGTVMTASIALGIAVDDTLHFLTFFRRGLEEHSERRAAVRFVYQHCGRAMVQSTVILTLGMLVFALSDFVPTRRFAWMMCGSLAAALAGDLIVLPALLLGPLGTFFRNPTDPQSAADGLDDGPPGAGGAQAAEPTEPLADDAEADAEELVSVTLPFTRPVRDLPPSRP